MAEQTAIELPSDNVTVLGAFNPAIIRPGWIVRNMPECEPTVSVLVPEDLGPLLFHAGALHWIVTRERLVVYGDSRQAGIFVAEILNKLPHTPLAAAGINIQQVVPVSDELIVSLGFATDQDRFEGLLSGRLQQVSVSHSVIDSDGVILTLKATRRPRADDLVLDFNFHRDAAGSEEKARASQLANHAAQAGEFAAKARSIVGVLTHG